MVLAGEPVVQQVILETAEYEKGAFRVVDAQGAIDDSTRRVTGATRENTKAFDEEAIALAAVESDISDLEKTQKIHMAQLHSWNMAILGVNMSMLGMLFNLKSMNVLTKEQSESFARIVGPMQLMMTFMGLAISIQMMYNMAVQQGVHSMRNMFLAMSAFGLLTAALLAKGPGMKALFIALAAAMGIYAIATWNSATAKAALNAQMGPIGWAVLATGVGLTVGFTSYIAMWKSKAKAFGGRIISSPESMTVGDVKEALVPLQSPSAAEIGLSGPEKNFKIYIEKMEVKADSPESMYRSIQRAVRQRAITSPRSSG